MYSLLLLFPWRESLTLLLKGRTNWMWRVLNEWFLRIHRFSLFNVVVVFMYSIPFLVRTLISWGSRERERKGEAFTHWHLLTRLSFIFPLMLPSYCLRLSRQLWAIGSSSPHSNFLLSHESLRLLSRVFTFPSRIDSIISFSRTTHTLSFISDG